MKTAISQNTFAFEFPGAQDRGGSFVSALSETGSYFGNALSEFLAEVDVIDTVGFIANLAAFLSILISGIINLILIIS